jgi:hypothetical protein
MSERGAGLETTRGSGALADASGAPAVPGRADRAGPQGADLRRRFDANRSEPCPLSLGQLDWLRRRGDAPYRAVLTRTSARLPRVTAATHGDVVWLDNLPIEAGNFYVMDRGYIDLRRLRPVHQAGAIFVTRVRPDVRHYAAASLQVH